MKCVKPMKHKPEFEGKVNCKHCSREAREAADEIDLLIKKRIDAELENTPDDMCLHVDMELLDEGIELKFTRTKKEGEQ
tara:strand:+ start:20850 stop:21086 length:237 start_codon:yes stop_codon:yes gene_type:complete